MCTFQYLGANWLLKWRILHIMPFALHFYLKEEKTKKEKMNREHWHSFQYCCQWQPIEWSIKRKGKVTSCCKLVMLLFFGKGSRRKQGGKKIHPHTPKLKYFFLTECSPKMQCKKEILELTPIELKLFFLFFFLNFSLLANFHLLKIVPDNSWNAFLGLKQKNVNAQVLCFTVRKYYNF